MSSSVSFGHVKEARELAHAELTELADVLATAIAWIASSAGSPISVTDAQVLLARIDKIKSR